LIDSGLELPDEFLSNYLLAVVGCELDVYGDRLGLLLLDGLEFGVAPESVLVEDVVHLSIAHQRLALLLDLGVVLVRGFRCFLRRHWLGRRFLVESVQSLVDRHSVVAFLERIGIRLRMVWMA
jgi:hypothetical protein